MSMKRFFVLCAGLVIALCVGVMSSCGPGNSGTTEEPVTNIEGVWVRQGNSNEAAAQFEFYADNKFTYQLSVVLDPKTTTTSTLHFSGTYRLSGQNAFLTFTKSDYDNWEKMGLSTTVTIKSSTELMYSGSSFIKK